MARTLVVGVLLAVACATARPGTTTVCTSCHPETTTVYLVRHAEKQKNTVFDDPTLTAAGRARAQALVRALADADIDLVYATQYRRTKQTVQPFADAAGIPVQTVRAQDTEALLGRIQGNDRGKNILVAGHSNTVPGLIRALGVTEPVTISSSDYGDLFVVTIAADGSATLERRRFDP